LLFLFHMFYLMTFSRFEKSHHFIREKFETVYFEKLSLDSDIFSGINRTYPFIMRRRDS